MKQNTYIIYDNQTEYVTNEICKNVDITKKFFSENSELTTDIITEISASCMGDFFYVIKSDKEIIFPDFDFSFKPDAWDKDYVHVWNSEGSVRLYNTLNVQKDPSKYSDAALKSGEISLKVSIDKIYTYPTFDIIFLSYDEEYADTNYNKLLERFPKAKRLHNEKGILRAHKLAARLSETDMFYIVDADAEIVPTFDFSYQPHSLDRNSVHVWYSHNPVNDLEYGYGGVKLFPTKALKTYLGSPVDFTTTVSKSRGS